MRGGRPPRSRDEEIVEVFRALSDPSRCRIVELLRETGELRVGDIGKAFEMSLNAVSKHIKVLEGAGLVRRRREGTTHFIAMRPEGLDPVRVWLDAQKHKWERRLDSLGRILTDRNEE